MVRDRPFRAPKNPGCPDLEWALSVFDDWMLDGRPELDGPPAEQWKVAMSVIRGDKRVVPPTRRGDE